MPYFCLFQIRPAQIFLNVDIWQEICLIKLTTYTGSLITIIITGMESSTRANGPCFNSPAIIPSLCMYVSSFTFCECVRISRSNFSCKETYHRFLSHTYECTFHARSEIVSATHDQQRLVLKQGLGQFLNFIIKLQYLANEIVEIFQPFDNLEYFR